MLKALILGSLELCLLPALAVWMPLARLSRRRGRVGLGPEPLINNVYFRQALSRAGYDATTFVDEVYHVTSDFDVRADRWPVPRQLRSLLLFAWCVARFDCLVVYLNGGPLGRSRVLWRAEPFLLRLAGVRTVVLAYGSDVQEMSRSPNLVFKNAISRDYPGHRLRRKRIAAQIDMWTIHAGHLVGGCEWVDYLYHWDSLVISHFAIDTASFRPTVASRNGRGGPFRVLHAPNHRNIKGTAHLIRAIERLKAAGECIELAILERVPNHKVRSAIAEADLVVDQLVIGWYAMFSIEAMAMGRPVICWLRDDLIELYTDAGLLEHGELPIISCKPSGIESMLRRCLNDRAMLADLGMRGPAYVERHHSLVVAQAMFGRILTGFGITPRSGVGRTA